MANAPIELGPAGRRAAKNVNRIRTAQGLELAEVSKRLADIGRPIGVPALSRIENEARRLDTADLVALAVVLGVTPNVLLFGSERYLGPENLQITKDLSAPMDDVWTWADGELPLTPATAREQLDFQKAAKPHRPPVLYKELPRELWDHPAVQELERAYKAAATVFERDRTVLDLLLGELRRGLEEPFDFDKWFGDKDVLSTDWDGEKA